MEQHLPIGSVTPTPPSPLVLGPSAAPSSPPSEHPLDTVAPHSLLRLEHSSSTSPLPSELTAPPPPSPQTDYKEFLQAQVASVIEILVEVAVEEMARHLEECLTSAIRLEFLQTDDVLRTEQISKLKRQLIQMNKSKTEQFALFMKELGRASTEKMKMLVHTGLIQVGLNTSKEKLWPEQVPRACDDGTNDKGNLSDHEEEEEDQSTPGNFVPSDNGHPTTKMWPEWETAEASALIPHTPSKQKTTSHSEHSNGQEQDPDLQPASHSQPTLTLLYAGDVAEENLTAQTADPGGANPGNSAHRKWRYGCAFCGEHFNDRNKFLYHSIQHKNWYQLKNWYVCSHCGEFFRTERQLKRHFWRHTGLKPHTCPDCGAGYLDGKSLRKHVRTHVTCTYCKKSFLKSSLGRHPCVDGELLISCQVCPATFNNDKDMFNHKYSHVPEDKLCLGDPQMPVKRVKIDRLLCEVCGLSYHNPLYFQSHMTVHTGEKLHGCEICGRKYRYHRNVLRHMMNHTDPKKHLCETCGKRFTQPVVLRAHQLIHSRMRVCTLCGKKFKTLQILNQHRRTFHLSFYSVSCEVCGKSFWRKAMLKYHMRLHTGESLHTCTECGKSFTLKFHMKSHKCLKSEKKSGIVHSDKGDL